MYLFILKNENQRKMCIFGVLQTEHHWSSALCFPTPRGQYYHRKYRFALDVVLRYINKSSQFSVSSVRCILPV